MTTVPTRQSYDGPVLFSNGFRPFFLLGSIYAGLAILVWLPVFYGEITLTSAFAPRDWHVHEMLYGYLPAVITGFLFTAIPNWTGRLPIRGTPLMVLVAVWIAGRLGVTFSAETGWFPAMLIDASFLLLVALAAAREIIAGRNWRNLAVVMLVLLLLAGNVAFHLEAHFQGSADIAIRAGIAVVVLLIALIGGRIVPSFTRNWLVRENPGRLPVPFGRFDTIVVAIGAVALAAWVVSPDSLFTGAGLALAGLLHLVRLGTLGRPSNRTRAAAVDPACRLFLRAAWLPAECGGRIRAGAGGRRHSCLDGGRGRHHDAGGDEPRNARAYRPATQRVLGHAGDLCRDRRRGAGANLRGDRARPKRAAAACRRLCMGDRLHRIRGRVRIVARGSRPASEAKSGRLNARPGGFGRC